MHRPRYPDPVDGPRKRGWGGRVVPGEVGVGRRGMGRALRASRQGLGGRGGTGLDGLLCLNRPVGVCPPWACPPASKLRVSLALAGHPVDLHSPPVMLPQLYLCSPRGRTTGHGKHMHAHTHTHTRAHTHTHTHPRLCSQCLSASPAWSCVALAHCLPLEPRFPCPWWRWPRLRGCPADGGNGRVGVGPHNRDQEERRKPCLVTLADPTQAGVQDREPTKEAE